MTPSRKSQEAVVAGDAASTVAGQGPASSATEVETRLERLEQALSEHTRRLDEVFRVGETASLLTALATAHAQLEHELEAWEVARRQEMEARATEARAAWEVERRQSRQKLDEEKARVKREWERDRDEHEHAVRSRRARLEDELKATLGGREQALAERERATAEAGRELEELRAAVKRFPAEVAAATDQVRADTAAGLRAEVVAATKDADVARGVMEARLADLQHLTAQQAARIAELERDLKDVTEKLREIAIKTVEGVGALAKGAPLPGKAAAGRKK